jgi:taurine--2-oxoglutarate transaminase
VLELVKNRETREPLSGFNQPMTEPMRQLSAALLANGLSTVLRWNWVFNTPPLIITEAEIREGLAILDQALTKADQFYEG